MALTHAGPILQMPARYAHVTTPAPMLPKRQGGTLAAQTAISGMQWESFAGLPRPSHAGHAALHHAPDRRRARVIARGVSAAAADPRPRTLPDRAWHLLGDVERTLLL